MSRFLWDTIRSPWIYLIPSLGSEFGWRAYLQPKLLPLGARKALLITGLIWGIWYWPLIAMENPYYGLDYPGAPWFGLLAITWFTVAVGVFLGWATIRGRSIWPALFGFGVLNGLGTIVDVITHGAAHCRDEP